MRTGFAGQSCASAEAPAQSAKTSAIAKRTSLCADADVIDFLLL
jgi:hypothetical protein